jgi:Protein of unknown function (DUF3768)
MNATTERIRALNDELRRNLPNGHAVMTAGVAALGPDAVARIVKTIAVYDEFCHANDPYQEHDFGSFDADGQAKCQGRKRRPARQPCADDHVGGRILTRRQRTSCPTFNMESFFSKQTYITHTCDANFDHPCCGRDHARQRIDLYPVEGSAFIPQSLFT